MDACGFRGNAFCCLGAFFFLPVILRFYEKYEDQALFQHRFFKSIKSLFVGISEAVELVKKSGKLAYVVGLSVAIRFLKYAGFYLLFCAAAYPSFKELSEVPVYQVVSALIGGELLTSLPILFCYDACGSYMEPIF